MTIPLVGNVPPQDVTGSINNLINQVNAALSGINAPVTPSYPSFVYNYNVKAFGAKGDGMNLTDLTITSGSAVVTSASYQFQSSDVGKNFGIINGASTTTPLCATIQSVSGGAATLSASAGRSVSGTATGTFGTDDSAAFQAAVNAATAANAVTQFGALIYAPAAIYIIGSQINWATRVSLQGDGWGNTILKWLSLTAQSTNLINAGGADFNHPIVDIKISDIECDGILGFNPTYTVSMKAIELYNGARITVERCYVHDWGATGIATDSNYMNVVCHNRVVNCGRLATGALGGGNGIGIGVGSGQESYLVYGNFISNTKRFAILFEAQSSVAATNSRFECFGNFIELGPYSTSSGLGDSGSRYNHFHGNYIYGQAGCGDGIDNTVGTVSGGTPSGQSIYENNFINGCTNGISVLYAGQPSVNVLQNMIISGNKIVNSIAAGINMGSSLLAMDTVSIIGNTISLSGSAGIVFNGAGGFKDIQILGNTIKNNAGTTATATLKCGISFQSVITRLRMNDNAVFDNLSGTQLYGVITDTVTCTGCNVQSNDLSNNATGAFSYTNSGALKGFFANNKGNTETNITANYTALPSDENINVTASGAVTITLPAAADFAGATKYVNDVAGNANTNNITISGVNGASKVLNTAYAASRVHSTGTFIGAY